MQDQHLIEPTCAESPISSKCSICVLTYNRCDQLSETLENLRLQFEHCPISVIVVNNASTDGTAGLLSRMSREWKGLRVINSETNLGCAKGRALAWDFVETEFILSIDDDISFQASDLAAMIRILETNERVGIVSPLIRDSASRKIINPPEPENQRVESFFEAIFLIRSETITNVGYMDSALAVAGEGLDYAIRARRSGFDIARSINTEAEHFDRPRDETTTAQRKRDWLWSFCYVYWKHYSPPVAAAKSTRNLAAHIRSGVTCHGLGFAFTLVKPAVLGAINGRLARFATTPASEFEM